MLVIWHCISIYIDIYHTHIMFNAVLCQQCYGEAIDHNDDRSLSSLSPYPKFTLQKRLQTGVAERIRRQPLAQQSQSKSDSREESLRLEQKKTAALFPPVVCGRRSLSLAHGPVGFPVSFHDLAGITQQVHRKYLHCCTRTTCCLICVSTSMQCRQTAATSTISFTFPRTSFLREE